jgi:glycosyltransferase involved in cell wall biosynthesis
MEKMTADPLVSILMPVRNEGNHLNACIQSICKQDYLHWELIAIDDHSSDDSWAVLKTLQSQDLRIHAYKNEVEGIIPSLQTALSRARGAFVTRMDADDLMLPSKISNLLETLREEKTDVSTGLVKYAGRKMAGGFLNYEAWVNRQDEANFWKDIYYECPLPSPCWMAKTELFRNAMGDPSLIYPEDYFWALWLYAQGASVSKCPRYLHLWRDYDERASRNDPNYADQSFLKLKLQFFLQYDYSTRRKLLLWGAGRKGKQLARKLLYMRIPFEWTSNNPEKTGKHIYEKKILHEPSEKEWGAHQIILAFSSPGDRQIMKDRLDKQDLKVNEDYFWFY